MQLLQHLEKYDEQFSYVFKSNVRAETSFKSRQNQDQNRNNSDVSQKCENNNWKKVVD